jgi:hypothetical protein
LLGFNDWDIEDGHVREISNLIYYRIYIIVLECRIAKQRIKVGAWMGIGNS